jgi:hypothetical protein
VALCENDSTTGSTFWFSCAYSPVEEATEHSCCCSLDSSHRSSASCKSSYRTLADEADAPGSGAMTLATSSAARVSLFFKLGMMPPVSAGAHAVTGALSCSSQPAPPPAAAAAAAAAAEHQHH